MSHTIRPPTPTLPATKKSPYRSTRRYFSDSPPSNAKRSLGTIGGTEEFGSNFGDPVTIAVLGALLSFFVALTAGKPVVGDRAYAIVGSVRQALPSFGASSPTPAPRSVAPTSNRAEIAHLLADLPGVQILSNSYAEPTVLIPVGVLFLPDRAELQKNATSIFVQLRRTIRGDNQINDRSSKPLGQAAGELVFSIGTVPNRTAAEQEAELDLTLMRAQALEQALLLKHIDPIPWRVTMEPVHDSSQTFVLFRPLKESAQPLLQGSDRPIQSISGEPHGN